MSEPGVWSEKDLNHILGKFGTFIIERAGSDMDHATESLALWRHNIFLVPQLIQNDVSSTKVRLFLRHGLSVRYLLPAPSVEYIEEHELHADDASSFDKKDNDQECVKDDAWKREGTPLSLLVSHRPFPRIKVPNTRHRSRTRAPRSVVAAIRRCLAAGRAQTWASNCGILCTARRWVASAMLPGWARWSFAPPASVLQRMRRSRRRGRRRHVVISDTGAQGGTTSTGIRANVRWRPVDKRTNISRGSASGIVSIIMHPCSSRSWCLACPGAQVSHLVMVFFFGAGCSSGREEFNYFWLQWVPPVVHVDKQLLLFPFRDPIRCSPSQRAGERKK